MRGAEAEAKLRVVYRKRAKASKAPAPPGYRYLRAAVPPAGPLPVSILSPHSALPDSSPAALTALVRHAVATAVEQYRALLAQLPESKQYPRTWRKGRLTLVRPADWTSGFFPGALWLLSELTGDAAWCEPAARFTAGLESLKDNRRTHDVGFMLYCSFGQGLRLTNLPAYRDVLLAGARSLASRFNPAVGCIKSWDTRTEWPYPVIIDNMMNLELLLWAARSGGEARFREIAVSHADVTLRNHFRPDGSSYHVIDYDPVTGVPRRRQTHQGAADESAWSRGQAWALYGYTFMFRDTGKPEYLEQAHRVARFILQHPRLPADKVPYWDFDAPNLREAPRDASAAAIICSALLELVQLVEPHHRAVYRVFAEDVLRSLCSPAYLAEPGTNGGFILKHSTGSFPRNSEIDVPLNYADYYFLEAISRFLRS